MALAAAAQSIWQLNSTLVILRRHIWAGHHAPPFFVCFLWISVCLLYTSRMRAITLALGICCVGLASASFDLMLLGDNTTAGAQRVVRYDPVNRVVLGSFGTGFFNSNIQDIAVDMSANRAYVLDSLGYVRTFDYYTGEFLQMNYVTANYNQITFDSVSGRVLFSSISGPLGLVGKAYTTTFSSAQNYSPNYGVYGNMARRTDGNYYAYWDLNPSTTSFLVPRMFNVTTGVSSGVNSSSVGLGTIRGSLIGNDGRFYGLHLNSGNLNLYYCNTSFSGLVGGAGLMVGLGGTTFDNQDMVWGHGNVGYILDGNEISTYYGGMGIAGTQTLSFATGANIRGMALVIAPEPGQFVALGVGLCGLFLRRRKRDS